MRQVGHAALAGAALGLLLAAGGCRPSAVRPDVQRATRTVVRELSPAAGALGLPLKSGSVRFAVIGDSGRGDQAQHAVAQQMIAWREKFPFDFVVMLGDNIYPPHAADDYEKKFEDPYRPLLDAGVKFYAAIGNHDPSTELNYPAFNMDGRRYYSFRRNDATSRVSKERVRAFSSSTAARSIPTSSTGCTNNCSSRILTGRSVTSIIRCIRPGGTPRRRGCCGWYSSRFSSTVTSTSC